MTKQAKDQRPLPALTELDTAEFWRSTQSEDFKFQKFLNCATVIWHPRGHCTGCLDGQLEWLTSSGKGTVYSFSVIRQSYHPFFRTQVPYVVAYVDLDEGPRFLTNVVDIANPETDVSIGQRVELIWETHEALSIPLVRPA